MNLLFKQSQFFVVPYFFLFFKTRANVHKELLRGFKNLFIFIRITFVISGNSQEKFSLKLFLLRV